MYRMVFRVVMLYIPVLPGITSGPLYDLTHGQSSISSNSQLTQTQAVQLVETMRMSVSDCVSTPDGRTDKTVLVSRLYGFGFLTLMLFAHIYELTTCKLSLPANLDLIHPETSTYYQRYQPL